MSNSIYDDLSVEELTKQRKSESRRKWRENNPEYAKQWYYKNREEHLKNSSQWSKDNKEHVARVHREARKKRKETNPEQVKIQYKRDNLIQYGLSLEQFNQMWQDQEGKCAICDTMLKHGTGGHAVDHCHNTGVVRSLLCGLCNKGIGCLQDDPNILLKAVDYLQRHKMGYKDDNTDTK